MGEGGGPPRTPWVVGQEKCCNLKNIHFENGPKVKKHFISLGDLPQFCSSNRNLFWKL